MDTHRKEVEVGKVLIKNNLQKFNFVLYKIKGGKMRYFVKIFLLLLVLRGAGISEWGIPVRIDSIGGYSPSISADGRWLYLHEGPYEYPATTYIAVSEFKYGVWQRIIELGGPVNDISIYRYNASPCISFDGTQLYFGSNRAGSIDSSFDIWVSDGMDTIWQTPINLANINTSYGEGEPSISWDGTKLYFASDRPGGYGGLDIWVSENNGGAWQTPVNLGPPINTDTMELGASISYEDTLLYFCRPIAYYNIKIYVSSRRVGINEGYNGNGAEFLGQSSPNPSNYEAKIDYSIETRGQVSLTVYDIKGTMISKLVNEEKSPGKYSTFWNGLDKRGKRAPAGLYFYQLSIGNKVVTKKAIILR